MRMRHYGSDFNTINDLRIPRFNIYKQKTDDGHLIFFTKL